MHARFLLPLLGILALSACKGSRSDSTPYDACSAEVVKGEVLSAARAKYLFLDELPAVVDLRAYPSPEALLDALTAKPRQAGRDRRWSALATLSEIEAYFGDGKNVGFGFSALRAGDRILIKEVIPGTGGAAAGIARGDELLAVAATPAGLDDPANQVVTLLADGTLGDSFQISGPGEARALRLRKASGATVDVMVIASAHDLDPVPGAASPTVFATANGRKVGYLSLRTFITPANGLLRTAAGKFREAGVTDLIVDLRYNGGGDTDVAEVLTNLLRAGHAGDVMYKVVRNARTPSPDLPRLFGSEPNALAPGRIAFIVTGESASASEMVINALQPYYGASLALVGARTFGKPVGMEVFPNPTCDLALLLVTVQMLNASGTGSYFQGLPDANFTGVTIPATDDLTHAPGSPQESSTAAALQWIATGAVPAAPAAEAALPPRSSIPLGSRPTVAQMNQPGLF